MAVSIAGAHTAAADPTWPIAGAESAAATIRDLQQQGYNVAINWVGGYRDGPLDDCTVGAIYNPDRSGTPAPPQETTVYVDVTCPHDNHSSIGVGVGF
ncbi:MAG: hypothetical protein QOH57_962 [Mycobacterium sp.]|nr:hypothetical protein [Mycobacterium sp.]